MPHMVVTVDRYNQVLMSERDSVHRNDLAPTHPTHARQTDTDTDTDSRPRFGFGSVV